MFDGSLERFCSCKGYKRRQITSSLLCLRHTSSGVNGDSPCVTEQVRGSSGSVLTGCFLEGGDGLVQPSEGLSVAPGSNLGEEGGHVEEDAGLLQRDVLLAQRHARERVVPGARRESVRLIQ